MYLAEKGYPIPRRYYHDPAIKNKNGNTVAMILA